MVFLQLRKAYPEDTFLVPVVFIATAIWALGVLVALFVGWRTKKHKVISVFETREENEVRPEPEYYMMLGNHEIRVEADEVKRLRRQNYVVLER